MRFSPGYSGCDIRDNVKWFGAILRDGGDDAELAGNAGKNGKINLSGYSVNPETGIITPRKSVICAIGWNNQRS